MIVKPVEFFLKEGEEVILKDKYNPVELIVIIFWSILFIVISFTIIYIGILKFSENIETMRNPYFVSGLSALFFTIFTYIIPSFIDYFTTEFVITNSRVFRKYGLIGNYTKANQLTKIEAVDVRQGIIDRMFGTFSVVVSGVGGDSTKTFGTLNNAEIFYKRLQELTDNTMPEASKTKSLENSGVNIKLKEAARLLIEVANDLDNKK